MKSLVLVAAALLASSAAIAQTTPTPSTTNAPSATTTPSTPTVTPTNANGQPNWYKAHQGEWRSSKLIGAKVKNNSGETIGDINDVLLTTDGKAQAVVIGVGGFLGVGEREVAVDFNSLQMRKESNGSDIVMLDVTKDVLKNAPAWTWQKS